jgi:hypothetical protein
MKSIVIAITAFLGLAIAAPTALESREECKYTEACKPDCAFDRRALDECLTCIPYCNQGGYLFYEIRDRYVSSPSESDMQKELETDTT